MEDVPVELWLRSGGPGALPAECLLGVPLLQVPGTLGLFRLVVSSLWTPLTWGDVVNAHVVEHEAQIHSLAASGPHLRVVLAHDPTVPRLRARTAAHAWGERGAVAVDGAPGLFVSAWNDGMTVADVRGVLHETTDGLRGWEIVEEWPPTERRPHVISEYLHRN